MHGPDKELQAALGSRYRLLRLLGKGGSAVVYLASDVKHRRRVALKALRRELADGISVKRFEREIALVGRLLHPHILALLDSGEAAGRPYFVMPFVPGESLAARLDREGRLSVVEAVRLACEVADAVDYANAAGVVHRDIKPSNVLLIAQHAAVADFGAGWAMRLLQDGDRTTTTGMIVGTPAYMSPEQGSGERHLDGRSDEYSLAVMLHELLTGALPFSGTNARAMIAQRFTSPPVPLRQVRDDVPEALEQAVLRALALDQDDRFATVGQFGDALHAAMEAPNAPARADPAADRAPRRPPHAQPSIAVLPFVALSAHRDDEYLGLGLSEEITNALGRLRSLRVVARTSVLHVQRDRDDLVRLGERLGATAVLEGSVQRSRGRIRLMARLIGTADGHQMWAREFVQSAGELFALQEQLAQAVVSALEVDLLAQSGRPLVRPPTESAGAHDLYLRGRFAWNKRTEAQIEQSVRLFGRAVEADPDFAAAHAALADAYLTLCVYGVREPLEVIPIARDAARRALILDPTAAEPHVAMGQIHAVHDWSWQAAEEQFRCALSLAPEYPSAHHAYAVTLLAPSGRHDEALRAARRAVELDPLSAVFSASVGVVLFAARRYDESIAQCERTLELEPNFGLAHYFMGQALTQLGALGRAVASFERAIDLSGRRLEIVSAFAHASALAGDLHRAHALVAELEDAAATRYVSPYLIAQARLGLGDRDAALDWLERAFAVRAAELAWIEVRGAWDAMRGTPRFDSVARAVRHGGNGPVRTFYSRQLDLPVPNLSPRRPS